MSLTHLHHSVSVHVRCSFFSVFRVFITHFHSILLAFRFVLLVSTSVRDALSLWDSYFSHNVYRKRKKENERRWKKTNNKKSTNKKEIEWERQIQCARKQCLLKVNPWNGCRHSFNKPLSYYFWLFFLGLRLMTSNVMTKQLNWNIRQMKTLKNGINNTFFSRKFDNCLIIRWEPQGAHGITRPTRNCQWEGENSWL